MLHRGASSSVSVASQYKGWTPICPLFISVCCQVLKAGQSYNRTIQPLIHQLINSFCYCGSAGCVQCLLGFDVFLLSRKTQPECIDSESLGHYCLQILQEIYMQVQNLITKENRGIQHAK